MLAQADMFLHVEYPCLISLNASTSLLFPNKGQLFSSNHSASGDFDMVRLLTGLKYLNYLLYGF